MLLVQFCWASNFTRLTKLLETWEAWAWSFPTYEGLLPVGSQFGGRKRFMMTGMMTKRPTDDDDDSDGAEEWVCMSMYEYVWVCVSVVPVVHDSYARRMRIHPWTPKLWKMKVLHPKIWVISYNRYNPASGFHQTLRLWLSGTAPVLGAHQDQRRSWRQLPCFGRRWWPWFIQKTSKTYDWFIDVTCRLLIKMDKLGMIWPSLEKPMFI